MGYGDMTMGGYDLTRLITIMDYDFINRRALKSSLAFLLKSFLGL
jgi:hypothetical protein